MPARFPKAFLVIDALKPDGATRKNIPTVEYQSAMGKEAQAPMKVLRVA